MYYIVLQFGQIIQVFVILRALEQRTSMLSDMSTEL